MSLSFGACFGSNDWWHIIKHTKQYKITCNVPVLRISRPAGGTAAKCQPKLIGLPFVGSLIEMQATLSF